MKLRGPLFFSVILLAILVGAAYYPAKNNSNKEAILIHTILTGLTHYHYDPIDVNDKFSKRVFDLYLDRIDGGRRFLTQKDLAVLKPYETLLDDEASMGNYDFFDKAVNVLEAGIKKTEGIYKDILAKPFDLTKKEFVELDGEKKAFAKDDAELKQYWEKLLKYDVMTRVANKLDEQAKDGADEKLKNKTAADFEKEAREAVGEVFDKWFARMYQERRSDHLSDYLNTVTNVFDPHTGYFAPKDKEDFDINMSGTLEGIGARLQTDGEYTKVVSIVPGGPAWKQKELQADDLIIEVSQGDGEAVDVTGYRIDDVVKLIRGKKGTEVRLKVKKVDGSTQIVPIIREVVILEEGYAKSVILDYPGKISNIGYINLPRFYADFNRRGGRSCATDIAKEIDKLKKEDVKGIILDLRNNGGGSLRDVVKMSGYFIEEGPIVQVKDRINDADVLSDVDPTVQYDGPLVIMVNNYSASASEIIAAALQDYGRAVIVGSGTSTFGKGTVQRFIDLDRGVRENADIKPLGNVKLTIQKFYRINGGSTQLKGVTPDIILPDNFQEIEIGERSHEFPMEWTKIESVAYSKSNSVGDLNALRTASAARVKNNKVFNMINDNAKRLKAQRDKTTFTLNLKEFRKEKKERQAIADKYEEMFTEIKGLKISNLEADLPNIQADSSKIARNDSWIETLQKDVYIDETLSIMKDMMN